MADENQTGFVKRVGQIAFGGFKDSMSSYFNDVASLKNDADTIKSQLIQDGKSASDVFNRMKKGMGSPAKKIHDWFYASEASMFGFSDGEDDFDAGFKPDSADEDGAKESEEARTLNAEDMTDIAKKQSAEQYKIASKQADLNIANTAEIVSAINSRSAEMTASVNKVNESLITISKKLDGIMGGISEGNKEQKKQASIFNGDGSLSLSGVFNAGREAFQDKTEMLSSVKTFAKFFTPETLASLGFNNLFEKEFSFLGGRSIEDVSRKLNNAITDTVQSGLMELVKNEKISDFFDFGRRKKDIDYQQFVQNNYNTKPAVFDGMTRQSIIHIIPEYLKNIEAAITNTAPKTINDKGQLTTRQENYFQNQIRNSMFAGTVMDYGETRTDMLNTIRSVTQDDKFSSKDLEQALKALKSGFLLILLNGIPFNSSNMSGNKYRRTAQAVLHPNEIGTNAPTTWEARASAIKMLVQASGKDEAYWSNVFDVILGIFDTNRSERQKFARMCTSAAEKVINDAEKYAKTHTHGYQAGKITLDLATGAFVDAYQRANYNDKSGTISGAAPVINEPKKKEEKPNSEGETKPIVDSSQSTSSNQSKSTFVNQSDELRQHAAAAIIPEFFSGPKGLPSITSSLTRIYEILNRGIDVFVTNKKHVYGNRTEPFNKNNGKPHPGGPNDTDTNSQDDQIQPHIDDYHDSTEANSDESTVEESEENDTEDGSKNGKKKKKGRFAFKGSVYLGALLGRPKKKKKKNSEEGEESTSESDAENSEDDDEEQSITSDILDSILPKGSKMRELYDNISESDRAKALKEKGKKIRDKAADKILGEETDEVDEDGNKKTKGGLLNWFGGKKEKATDKAKNIVEKGKKAVKNKIEKEESKLSDNQILERTSTNIKRVQKAADSAVSNAQENGKEASSAQQDQMIVQQVTALIDVAMKDGDISSVDTMTINNLINQVKDPKIKKQLKQAVIPMMRRNSVSVSDKSTGSNTSSDAGGLGLGSFMKTAVKYAGLLFKPITKILGSGLKVLGGISGLILKISGTLIKSGAKDIYYGTKSVAQSMFGSKKEGEESVGLIRRIFSLPNRLTKSFNTLTNNVIPKMFNKLSMTIGKTFRFITDVSSSVFKGIGRGLVDFGSRFISIFSKDGGILSKLQQTKIGKTVSNLAQDNDFIKGLTSARREKQAAKEKSLMDSPATTKSEALVGNINTVISEIKTSWEDNFKKEEEETSEFRLNLFTKLDMFSELLGNNDEENEEGSTESEDNAKDDEEKTKSLQEQADEQQKQKSDNQGDKQTSENNSSSSSSDSNKNKSKSNNDSDGDSNEGGQKKKSLVTRVKDKISSAREAGSAVGSAKLDIGKSVGGILNILGGIAKIVVGAITALEGFKQLTSLIQNTLTKSLTPLNKAFQKVIKVLKPVLNTVMNSIKSISVVVTDIVSAIVDSIQPILTDIIGPLLEQLTPIIVMIGNLLSGLMPIIKTLVEVLIMPLVTTLMGLVVPAITLIANVIQIVAGAVEMLIGATMSLGGMILQAIGKLPGAGGVGKAGESMNNNGKSLIAAGAQMAGAGIRGIASTLLSSFQALIGKDEEEKEEEPKEEKKKAMDPMKGSVLEGWTGNGDTTIINNTYNNSTSTSSTGQIGDISNIYGSGDSQKSYGGYLGMDKHGCGPTALADAVGRRTGQKLSASALASAMSGNGTYSSSNGTSAAGFMRTSAALGSNVTPGGVTQNSLKRATPNNPVTLLGSGGGFGTRSGNNHYVNVIGSNGRGTSYVSNPMTGRIEGRPTSELVSHSVLGLYGSGDEEGSGDYYTFPEAVSDAINELKSMAANLLKMFTGPTAEEQMQEELDKKKQEQALKDAENQLGDDFAKFDEEARGYAADDYMTKHAKLDSETDAEYEAKIDEYYTNNRMKYLARTKVLNEASEKSGDMFANLLNFNDSASETVESSFNGIGVGSSVGSHSFGSGVGGFYNEDGSARMFDFSPIIHKETNITSGESGESPVHDFFGAMAGTKTYSSSNYENWYQLRQNPNVKGVGQSGDGHRGVDFQFEGGNAGKPLYTITGGTVTEYGYSGGCGNAIEWTDDSGVYSHIYMHMEDLPAGLKPGDRVEAGTLVGHVGNTGASDGAHLHYGMYKDSSPINPLEYWHFEEAAELPGNTNRDKIWSYMVVPQAGGGMGLSKHGAAGILANMETESHFEPRREEGNYPDPIQDTSYCDNVDNGSYSLNQFVNDAIGFGLVQWTPSDRKSGLWEFTRGKNMSIGNLRGQLEYFRHEMETNGSYASMLENMRSNDQSYTYMNAMEDFLRKYEVPSHIAENIAIRGPQARDIYNYYENMAIPDNIDTTLAKTYEKVGSGTANGKQLIINSAADAALHDSKRPSVGDYVTIEPGAKYYNTDVYGGTKYAAFGTVLQNLNWKLDSVNEDGTYNIKSIGDHPFVKRIDFGYVTKREVAPDITKPDSDDKRNPEISNGSGYADLELAKYDEMRKAEELKYGTTNAVWASLKDYATAYYNHDEDNMKINTTRLRSMVDVNGKYIEPSEINWDSSFYKFLAGQGDSDMSFDISPNIDTNMEIPPIDIPTTDQTFWNDMGFGRGTTVNYNITKSDDKGVDDRVKSILNHTFEVKSASIESILTKILDRMEEKRTEQSIERPSSPVSNQKLFEERIPSSISKLSIG